MSQDHGSVLWNKASGRSARIRPASGASLTSVARAQTSWVWFHPQLPFTLRFNFKRADSLFAFHGVKGDAKPGQHTVLPSWKWNGKNGLQPVLSASAQLDPEIKSQFCSVVVTAGQVPLPVLVRSQSLLHALSKLTTLRSCQLLAAMMKHIRWVRRAKRKTIALINRSFIPNH